MIGGEMTVVDADVAAESGVVAVDGADHVDYDVGMLIYVH